MDKILQFINSKTNDKWKNLQFKEAVLDAKSNTIQINFEYPKIADFTENFDDLTVLCKEYLSKFDYDVKVNVKKFTLSLQKLKSETLKIANDVMKGQLVTKENLSFDFDGDKTVLTISYGFKISEQLQNEYANEIEKQIFEKYNYSVVVKFVIVDAVDDVIIERERDITEENLILESEQESKVVKIKNVNNVYGEINDDVALLVGNMYGNESVTVAGVLESFAIKETKPKENTDEKDKKQRTQRKYLSFELSHNGQSVKCYYFLTKEQQEKNLENGKTYVITGSVNKFNETESIRVKAIAECEIVFPKTVWRKCPKQYNLVRPEKFVQTEQVGLFFVEKETENKYLRENTFVVYDLETTGINLLHDKIIDIGAYKVVNGKIVEKFCTYVNPEIHIPEEASKVNRITDDMVAEYPNIDKILPDFYKFCYGSKIVGYNNIGFDDVFINREGRRLKYNFDNGRDDVINIARTNLPGLKNYKLGTVCANQNVPLIDAHRASNDALATAKLFIKLAEKFC